MTTLARLLTALALSASSTAVLALGQNNYDNVGAYLSLREIGEGPVIGGSLELSDSLYGLASVGLLSEGDMDFTTLRGGVGLNLPIELNVPGLTFVADAALALTFADAGDDDVALELRGGAHYLLMPGLTAGAYLARVEGDRKDTYLAADLRYQYHPSWAVHGGVDRSDNDGIYVGIEYLFTR